MTVNVNHIHVFKTNISEKHDLLKIKVSMDLNLEVSDWSIDIEDVDCVLRVVSDKLTPATIIHQITSLGYSCIELE